MEFLDFQLVMQDHPMMDDESKGLLMAGDVLGALEPSLHRKLPQQVTARGSLTAQVEQTAIFVTDDWVVTICGKRLLQCVSAMLILKGWVERQLEKPTDIRLLGLRQGKGDDLDEAVRRDRRKEKTISIAKWVGGPLLGALVGFFLQWLFCRGVLP